MVTKTPGIASIYLPPVQTKAAAGSTVPNPIPACSPQRTRCAVLVDGRLRHGHDQSADLQDPVLRSSPRSPAISLRRAIKPRGLKNVRLRQETKPEERVLRDNVYQVPMRKTASVVKRIPFCGRMVPTSPIQVCVYCKLMRRQANGRLTMKSTPPPVATLTPLFDVSMDQSLRFG